MRSKLRSPPMRDSVMTVEVAGKDSGRMMLRNIWKAVAPSTQLRTWYAHDVERFDEFVRRYKAELEGPEQAKALAHLKTLVKTSTVTLLTATKDVGLSQAAVLAGLLH